MEDCDRTYRPHNEIHVRDWNSFKQVWGDFNFIKSLGDPKSSSCTQIIHEQLETLISNHNIQCFVFPQSLKYQYVNLFKQIVCSPCYEQLLDYQFQALYLDKPKQLVVYRKKASVQNYLTKYRLNKSYGDLFSNILQKWKDALQLIIERNLKISNEASKDEIDKITFKINHFNKFSLDPILNQWRQLTNRIMLDFKSQPRKQEIQFLGVNDLLTRQIKNLCNYHELYFSDKYQKVSSQDQNRDMIVTKTDRNFTNYLTDYYLTDDDTIENQHNISIEAENQNNFDEKPIYMVEPRGFKNITFLCLEQNGAKCLVQLQPSDIRNPVQFIQIRLIQPSTDIQSSFIQQIQVQNNQTQFHIILPCLSLGFTHFELTTGNTKGLSIHPSYLKIWFQGTLAKMDDTGMMKLTNNNNYSLYVLGRNQAGLIPNQSKKSMQKNEIVKSTDEKWQKTKFQCSDFSISTHAIISNRIGDVAGWGKMYYFDCMGQDQKNDIDEEIDPFTQILSEKFRIEQPSLILKQKYIRQVSCGQGYCLMVDCLGKAWSFGINTFGQLGLDHLNENIDTTQPTIIPFFRRYNIFIREVTASIFGASFAIDDKGQAYRWGTNQIQQTNQPIKDNYHNIINFQYQDIYVPQCIPIPISSKFISDKIMSIQAGMQFVLALTENNKLYAWGSAKFYGKGRYEDAHFHQINNFCNPINVRQKIAKISVGEEHILALTTDGDLLGWGKSIFFRDDSRQKFVENAEIVAHNYQGFFTCGTNFSILEYEGKAKVIGRNKHFKKRLYELPCVPQKILASEGTIFVMGTPIHQNEKVNMKGRSPFHSIKFSEASMDI